MISVTIKFVGEDRTVGSAIETKIVSDSVNEAIEALEILKKKLESKKEG